MMDREDNNNLAISVKEEEFRWDKGCYLVDCSHCWTNVFEQLSAKRTHREKKDLPLAQKVTFVSL